MNLHARSHVLSCVVLVAGLYSVARVVGWTGPNAWLRLDPDVVTLPIMLISLWGLVTLVRKLKGSSE